MSRCYFSSKNSLFKPVMIIILNVDSLEGQCLVRNSKLLFSCLSRLDYRWTRGSISGSHTMWSEAAMIESKERNLFSWPPKPFSLLNLTRLLKPRQFLAYPVPYLLPLFLVLHLEFSCRDLSSLSCLTRASLPPSNVSFFLVLYILFLVFPFNSIPMRKKMWYCLSDTSVTIFTFFA